MLKKLKNFLLSFKADAQNIEKKIDELSEKVSRSNSNLHNIREIMLDEYIAKNLFNNPKYSDNKRLNQFEKQFFSQNGEDGIIEEIFKRIGTTDNYFVEFGVENGTESNGALLLIKGWKGSWIEADKTHCEYIQKNFASLISKDQLKIKNAFIDAENIESLFKELNVPEAFDLLSIDIDMNDYWVWKAITNYKPRVVVIEYNYKIPSDVKWVVEYDPKNTWDGSTYLNAGLKSLELLGREKGYSLVGCNYTGVNAFFVRNDLVQDLFQQPFTAENHYEPPRGFLKKHMGKGAFGPFLNV